jgi:myo-inositol-1-phosphate synthase
MFFFFFLQHTSIAIYNHLGQNDNINLSVPQVFRSKEMSKRGVVDDMVTSNNTHYNPREHPGHIIIIEVPSSELAICCYP